MLVKTSRGTSFDVHVFGTSNSRTVVYKGTSHYVNGCMCRGKLASGRIVALRALSKVGVLGLRANGKIIGSMAMSVNAPLLSGPKRVTAGANKVLTRAVLTSKGRCGKAFIYVKGPRIIVFMSSVGRISLPTINPGLRGRPLFPRQAGIRFMRVLPSRSLQVEI